MVNLKNLKKKLSRTILEEELLVPRNTAASRIDNVVITLLWQLRCHCNPDHDKFSSLSNTAVVVIFLHACYWRCSLCPNLGDIDPKKTHRATLIVIHRISTADCSPDDVTGCRFKCPKNNTGKVAKVHA